MSLPDTPPNPSTYRGVRLRTFLEDLHRWIKRDRIIAGVGVAIESTPAGRKISAGAGASGGSSTWILAYAASSISGRSSGTVTAMSNPTTLSASTMTVYNAWESTVPATRKVYIGPAARGEAVTGYTWYIKQYDCVDWSPA